MLPLLLPQIQLPDIKRKSVWNWGRVETSTIYTFLFDLHWLCLSVTQHAPPSLQSPESGNPAGGELLVIPGPSGEIQVSTMCIILLVRLRGHSVLCCIFSKTGQLCVNENSTMHDNRESLNGTSCVFVLSDHTSVPSE